MNQTVFTLVLIISFSLTFAKSVNIADVLKQNPKLKYKLVDANVKPIDFAKAFRKCSDLRTIKYMDETPFIIEEPSLCKGRVSIFIAIHSNTPHYAHRQLIRETYGSLNRINNHTIRMAFFVGASDNEEHQKQLLEESRINRDIIQRDYHESYRNMSRKHLTVMEWTSKNCNNAAYLLKTDDDIFVDLFHLVREIDLGHADKGFLCSATKGSAPVRNKKGSGKKWFVTKQEYSKRIYPVYCEGLGYVLPIRFIPQIYACSLLHKFFWIDDVYVSGILAEALRIPRIRFSPGAGFHFMLPSHASANIVDGVFYVPYWSQLVQSQAHKMWQATLKYSMVL